MLSLYTVDIARNYTLPQVQFSSLNLSQCSITIINQMPTKLLFISQLYLDNNLLQSLTGIEQFMNLQILSVNFNFIQNKQEILKINNKFLIKELSFIGNPIQIKVKINELKKQGFYNLITLNNIKSIAKEGHNSNCFLIKQHPINKNQSLNNKSFSNTKYNYSIKQPNHQYDHPLSMSRENTQPYLNQSMRNSQFIYLTKRQQSILPNSKRQKQFESTGDTRKRKLSSFRAIENSKYQNSLQSSPNFNNKNYSKSTLFSNQSYRQSLPNRKVTEFNLYPVDQEMNRSRNLQNSKYQQYQQQQNYRISSNEDESIQSNSFKKIKEFHKTINYDKRRVNPFEQTEQIQYPMSQDQRYRPYRSQKYQIKNHRMSSQNYAQYQQEQEQQVWNKKSENGFLLIQKQIPIYKQAIGIAFYYRNLLQKVFRGFQSVMGRQIKLKSQDSSNSSRLNKIKTQNSHQSDKYKVLNQSSQNNKYQVSIRQLNQKQIQLLRYAWMKIQLNANYQKIMQKYQSSH